MSIKYAFGVLAAVSLVFFAVVTTDGLRTEVLSTSKTAYRGFVAELSAKQTPSERIANNLTTQGREQLKVYLAKHPEPTQRWSNIYHVGTTRVDSVLLSNGLNVFGEVRVVYRRDEKPVVELYPTKFTAGSHVLARWWVGLLLGLFAVGLWWHTRARWWMTGVTIWTTTWVVLSSSAWLVLAQIWVALGAAAGIGVGLWSIILRRRRASTQKGDHTVYAHGKSVLLEEGQRVREDCSGAEISAAKETGDTSSQGRQGKQLRLLLFVLGILFGSALAFYNQQSVDSGFAALIGAQMLLDGKLIYGAVTFIANADTYPPLMYIGYIPGFLFGPEVYNSFYPIAAAAIWDYILYLVAAVLLYRRFPVGGIAWAFSVPVVFALASAGNDMLFCFGLVGAVLGYAWGYPFAAGVKLIPLAWFGAWVRAAGRRDVFWLIGFGVGSLGLVVALGGTDAVGKMFEALSFQTDRQSWADMAVLFGWEWWHPLTRAVLCVLAIAAFTARRGEMALWGWTIGCAALLNAYYTNNLYASWIWVLALAVAFMMEGKGPTSRQGSAEEVTHTDERSV